jgi:hypothetical protein
MDIINHKVNKKDEIAGLIMLDYIWESVVKMY